MERATSLTIGALLVLLSSIASAQTTYQDALKIHALRDAFGSDGISAEQIMFAVENDAANAGFNGGSATDGVPVLPPSGGVDVGTTHPASAIPKQKFNDATRTRIIVRIKKEQEWITKFLALKENDVEGLKSLIASRPDHFEFLNAMLSANGIDASSISGTGLGVASLLGFDEAKIIQGITDWAMKQAQAELMQAFMKQWLDKLYANNYLGLMLPTTLNTIKTTDLGALISNGALWKASFQHDLDAVPDHVDSLIVLVLKDINTHDPPEPVYDEIGASALLFGTVYRGLKSGQDLETIISSEAYRVVYTTPTLPVSRATDYAMVHRALAGGAALLEATRTEKDGKFNGHLDPLLLLKMDSVTFHDYWKYTCVAHAAQLRVALKVDYADLLLIMEQKWKVGGQLFEARKHMLDVVETAQAIKAMLAPDGNAEKKKFDAQQAVRFAGLVLRLLENGSDMAVLADPASRMTIERNVRPIMNDLMRVDASVIAADYGGAISGIIDLTERFISLDTTRANGEKLKAFSAAINKYGNFMVDILTADSSTNVEAALRKATLGTGGYRVKLTSKAAATISLFPGAFVGQESVSLDNGNTRLTDPSVGAFLPIGISLTAATNWKVLPDVGFYLQAIDLGAALNYRLTSSDSVGASPAYSFKSMLSPGAYITTHLGRSPLVLGIGANLTPAMREVTSGTVTTQVNALRFGIFLGVDVTAFQLAASRKKFGDSSGTYRDLHDENMKKKNCSKK